MLLLTWDGAGNAVPFQAVVQALVQRGHDVGVWSHASSRPAFAALGARFSAYPSAADYDTTHRFGATEAEHARWVFANVIASAAIGRDATAAIRAESPDAVVVDESLLMAHAAAQAEGIPAGSISHFPVASARARRGRNTTFAFALEPLNAFRATLGLRPASSILEAIEATGPAIAATAPTFDPPAPESPAIQVGPIRPTEQTAPAELPEGGRPLVLVGLSSGWMHQIDLLQRILNALADLDVTVWMTLGRSIAPDELHAPDNATLLANVPHDRVLPATSLLITHAGHGTVLAGLAHAVPMMCIPLGRDQPANAARAAELGAAEILDPHAAAGDIRSCAARLLADVKLAERCRTLSVAIRSETRLDIAVDTIERLAT